MEYQNLSHNYATHNIIYESSESRYCFQIHHIRFFEIIYLIHFSDKESKIHSHLSIFVLVVYHEKH